MKFGKFPRGLFGSSAEKEKPLGTPEEAGTPELDALGVYIFKVVTQESHGPIVRIQGPGHQPIDIMPLGRRVLTAESEENQTAEEMNQERDELYQEVVERLTKVAQETNSADAVWEEVKKINGDELARIVE